MSHIKRLQAERASPEACEKVVASALRLCEFLRLGSAGHAADELGILLRRVFRDVGGGGDVVAYKAAQAAVRRLRKHLKEGSA